MLSRVHGPEKAPDGGSCCHPEMKGGIKEVFSMLSGKKQIIKQTILYDPI